jgi:hypothetical protein
MPGKPDVADQQIDALRRIEDRHRTIGITSFDKGIAQITQHRADQHPHGRVILDDQDRFSVVREQVGWRVLTVVEMSCGRSPP